MGAITSEVYIYSIYLEICLRVWFGVVIVIMVFCIMSRTLPLTGWWTGYNYPPALRCQVLGPLLLTRYEYVCDLHQNAYSFSVDSGDRPICAQPGCFTGTWSTMSLPQPCYSCMIVQGLLLLTWFDFNHYDDVTMSLMASQITSLTVVYSIVYSDADQRKHQSSASLAFVWGIHRDRWIPRTNGQLRGKCFHLMTSSCPAWISDHMPSKVCDDIAFSFPTVTPLKFGYGWIISLHTSWCIYDYVSMLGFKFNHVNKRGPRSVK